MAVRDIIRIDESKCNGCGDCVTACAEGALAIVNGKAKLVGELFCDGMGACLSGCPTGALTIEKREADEYDEAAVEKRQSVLGMTGHAGHGHPAGAAHAHHAAAPHAAHGELPCGCPGSAARQFDERRAPAQPAAFGRLSAGSSSVLAAVAPIRCAVTALEPAKPAVDQQSALTHWPIQLRLIRPESPVYRGADILIAADCTAFAFAAFHPALLAGKRIVIACPKLDDRTGYVEKLTELFRIAKPKSVTVARMEVPCCGGLTQMATEAHAASGCGAPFIDIVLSLEGEIRSERRLGEVAAG
jgi:ferredoxin